METEGFKRYTRINTNSRFDGRRFDGKAKGGKMVEKSNSRERARRSRILKLLDLSILWLVSWTNLAGSRGSRDEGIGR